MQNLFLASPSVKTKSYFASKGILAERKNIVTSLIACSPFVNSALFFSLIFFIFSSCTSTKKNTYFQNLQKDTTLRNLVSKDFEPKIQKGDLLGITVASLSPDIAFYNAPQNIVGPSPGYLVDESGNISFLKLGVLHVEQMTRKELKDTLQKSLVPYLKDAVVSVGFLNRHVTILGGIGSQVIPLINDNMTILDALATGGDIGDRGRSDNVLLIRENEDNKEFKRLNLTDHSIFYSPYFYLRPNDIVYIEPKKSKINNTAQIFSYVTSGITFLIFILDRLKL